MNKFFSFILVCWGLLLPLQAAVIYDESTNGPASNSYMSPTPLGTLSLGFSTVNGSVSETYMGGNYTTYSDYYTFTIPTNDQITNLSITDSGVNQWAWIGTSTYSSQLGFTTHVTTGNLIQEWNLTSIGAGTYGMYLEDAAGQGSNNTTPYTFTFDVIPAPEPSPYALFILGASILCAWCGFRRASLR